MHGMRVALWEYADWAGVVAEVGWEVLVEIEARIS
jgi:hypothetical protein